MALSNATVSLNLHDYLGADFDVTKTRVTLTTNADSNLIADTSTGEVRVGGGSVTLASDGTAEAVVWTPGADGNPTSWQTTFHIDYVNPATRRRTQVAVGPFTIDADSTLAALIEEQAVPPTYLSTVTELLDGYVTDAEAAQTAAAASATAAAASASDAQDSADAAAEAATGFATVTAVPLAPGEDPTTTVTGTAPTRNLQLGIPAGLADDASMTAVATDTGSAFYAAQSASIEAGIEGSGYLPTEYVQTAATSGMFAGVIDALRSGQDAAITVLSDSTGDATTEWPELLMKWIGQQVPTACTRRRSWSDATQRYLGWATGQVGAGLRHALFPASCRTMFLAADAFTRVTGDLEIEVQVALDDWTPATECTIVATSGSDGSRSWFLNVDTSGNVKFTWYPDGTVATQIQKVSSPTGFTDGSSGWIKVTLDVDNGAGGYTWKAYKSTDRATWTEIGSSVVTTGGATSYFATTQEYEIGGRGGVASMLGKVYEVAIRNGIDGPVMNPQPITSWTPKALSGPYAAPTFGGGATLYVNVGALAGSSITYHSDPTRLPKLAQPFLGQVVFMSLLHNSGSDVGAPLLTKWDSFLAALKTRLPSAAFCLVTQNPQVSPRTVDVILPQAERRRLLITWAARVGIACIDTYRAFTDQPDGGVSKIQADGIHPTLSTGDGTSGQDLWTDAVKAAFIGRL